MVELESDDLAQQAVERLSEVTIQDQKPVVMYALRTSPHQFESKCNTGLLVNGKQCHDTVNLEHFVVKIFS